MVFGTISEISVSIDTRINPYVIPVTSLGYFDVGPCWDLGMFQAIIYISSEHNVSKNNKDKLFSTVLT